jgi:hypothetical protein
LFDQVYDNGKEMEEAVWSAVVDVGRQLLEAMLALACWRVVEPAFAACPGARLRLDRDYTVTQTTTFGTVRVPLFAYREESGKTRSPAKRAVFPLHPRCRSSELCLEWETKLGGQLPYRQAQDSLRFFTHNATTLEDSTIARHTAMIGAILDRSWTYRSPEDIAELLRTRATRDVETGKPLLYFSTDAHALRRYVDDSYAAAWKMINGIRMWCVNKENGQIIHLGGEYTWGDCRQVATCFEQIISTYVPTGEDAPQVVMLTDGMEWIRTHVHPKMPVGTLFILDFYHAVEHVADYAKARFGGGTKAAKAWYSRVRAKLFGKRGYTKAKRTKRRGPRGKKATTASQRRTIHQSKDRHGAGEELVYRLLEEEVESRFQSAYNSLLHYISENADRMDYPNYRARGIQVGSGAMESLHRIASQMRLKLAGARWVAQNALAVLNTRMMMLAKRWDEFWSGPELRARLEQAFSTRPAA